MAAMAIDLTRIERSDEPVQGWRVWNLREDPWQLEPAGS